MALSEDKILTSIHIHLESQTIDILWSNRVLRDGVPLSVEPLRGAYPIGDDGEPDDAVVSLMGKSVADILGDALAASQRSVAELRSQLGLAQAELRQCFDEIDRLNGERQNYCATAGGINAGA